MGERVKYIGPLNKFKGLRGDLLEIHGDGTVQVRWDNGLLEWHDSLSVYPYAAEPAEPAPLSSFVTSNDPVNQPQDGVKYLREIKPGVFVDVYDVLRAFAVVNPALQHLIKKALAVGQRGHKDAAEDLQNIYESAKRAIELEQDNA